jgi:hypothetical protein
MIASIILLASIVGSWVFEFVVNPMGALAFLTPSAYGSPPNFHFSSGFYLYAAILLIISGAVEIFAMLLVRSSFKSLENVDRPHFRMPSFLILFLVVALPILFLGILVELSALPAIAAALSHQKVSPATPPVLPPTALGRLLTGIGISALGGLIALIGLIGGAILGLWRVGGRYNSTLIKVGAILIIIPLLDIIVPILMIIGVWQVEHRIFPATSVSPTTPR